MGQPAPVLHPVLHVEPMPTGRAVHPTPPQAPIPATPTITIPPSDKRKAFLKELSAGGKYDLLVAVTTTVYRRNRQTGAIEDISMMTEAKMDLHEQALKASAQNGQATAHHAAQRANTVLASLGQPGKPKRHQKKRRTQKRDQNHNKKPPQGLTHERA